MTQIWATKGAAASCVSFHIAILLFDKGYIRLYPINQLSNMQEKYLEVIWHSATFTGRMRLWLL